MELRLALVGAGMFGGDVHARTYADLQRSGLSPYLARVGLGDWARDFAPLQFRLVAIATRSESSARSVAQKFEFWTGYKPKCYSGETSWHSLLAGERELDVIAVATPDHLHTPVILDALQAGAHVLAEKPLCLHIGEADQIIELARKQKRLVALDMHKRYDPDHLRIRNSLLAEIGEPLYGLACLEEPIEVSTSTFKWATESDPFSYVGSHWVDLIYHYFHSKPISLTAVGQKKRLRRQGIDAYDAVQVRVDYQNGMSICYHNNWITPPDFEGPVNQGHEIVGTEGKIESDQQYRGLRWWRQDGGSRTANSHFTREVKRPDGSGSCVGYGVDSIVASLASMARAKFFGASPEELTGLFPNADEGRVTVAILHAARLVRDLNFQYLQSGKPASVSARFGPDGITVIDPNRLGEGAVAFDRIYPRPV